MKTRFLFVLAPIGAFVVLACSSSGEPAAPSALGGQVELARWTAGGTSAKAGAVDVPVVRDARDYSFVNVALDLDNDGHFAAYTTADGSQEEWVVKNVPIVAIEDVYSFAFELTDGRVASDRDVRLRVALSKSPIDETKPWDGNAPDGAFSLSQNARFADVELATIEGSPETLAGGGSRAGSHRSTSSHAPAGAPASAAGASADLGDTPLHFLADPPPRPDEDLHLGGKVSDGTAMPVRPQGASQRCAIHSITSSLMWLGRNKCKYDKVNGHPSGAKAGASDFDAIASDIESLWLGIERTVTPSGRDSIYTKGGGVRKDELLNGKKAVVDKFGLPIDTTRVPPNPTDDSGAGVLDAIAKAIADGCAFEINLGFYDKGQLQSGHTVAGTGIKSKNGKTSISYLDSNTTKVGTSINLGHDDVRELAPPKDGQPPTFKDPYVLHSQSKGTLKYESRIESVIIECCKKPVACLIAPPSGTYAVAQTAIDDPAGHSQYIGNPFAAPVQVASDGSSINVTGPAPFVAVSGNIGADCAFAANGTGVVAGRSNVSVRMDGTLTSATQFSGTYTMGANGELPQGKAMTLSFTATKQ